MTEPVRRLCVIGVGLIGGSFARALRERGLVQEVVGVGRSRPNLEQAKRLGVVDRFTHDAAAAARGADLILLATPVRAMPGIVEALRGALAPKAIITDAGSTKAGVVRAIEPLLPSSVQFVPGHPIAGQEKTGVSASKADLFQDHWVILTPTARTAKPALQKVGGLWKQCGARVELMEAEEHDRVFGAVSHLPHMVAYALVDTILQWEKETPLLGYSAGGLKDFTRIAQSSPEMWRDICLENQEAILEAMDRYLQTFRKLRNLIKLKDEAGLKNLFIKARKVRKQITAARRSRP